MIGRVESDGGWRGNGVNFEKKVSFVVFCFVGYSLGWVYNQVLFCGGGSREWCFCGKFVKGFGVGGRGICCMGIASYF